MTVFAALAESSSLLGEWFKTPLIVSVGLGVAASLIGIGVWVGRVNSDRTNFKTFMKDVGEKLEAIQTDIKQIFKILPPSETIRSDSPIQLTELGEKVSKEIGAMQFANETVPVLENEAKGLEPFEIESLSQDYVFGRLPENWRRNVGRASYKFGINTKAVSDVLWVVLRDELLAGKQKKEGKGKRVSP